MTVTAVASLIELLSVSLDGATARPLALLSPMTPQEPEEPWVRRALHGDRRAFDELYACHVDRVHALLSRLIGPDPDREDLVQQVFLEAFRALPSFRGESAFGTWLHRIVVRLAYHHLRQRARRPTVPLGAEAIERLLGAEASEASPEARVRRSQEMAQALAALARLSAKKRIAFVLRMVEGLSLEEIGQLVGARPPAVGQRVKHAQRELAKWAQRWERDSERTNR